MSERKYLHSYPDLVDRLSIVLLKAIRIPENRAAYLEEMKLIEHDIGIICHDVVEGRRVTATLLIMLANDTIWLNEAEVRKSGAQPEKLAFSHAINGIRNTAKNVLARSMGGRVDLKIDSLAADGAEGWNVFEDLADV